MYEKDYYGHAYVWISPQDETFALLSGPMIRVDECLAKGLPCLRRELIEAAQEFAREKGCNRLGIVECEDLVGEIAEGMGAKDEEILNEYIEESVFIPRGIRRFNLYPCGKTRVFYL